MWFNRSPQLKDQVANSFPHVAGIEPGTPGVSTYVFFFKLKKI